MPRIRTGYSFRAAVGKIEDVMDRVQECNYPAAPITDRASTFGFNRWNKLAKKRGLKPVFGVELAVSDSWMAKKPTIDHWTFFAIDSVKPINELVALATQQFRYEPILNYQQAMAAQGVFRVIGHRSLLDLVEPDERTFVALAPGVARGYARMARERGLSLVASSDNKFPRVADLGFYEVLCGRGASNQTYPQHILSSEEWYAAVARTGCSDAELAQARANEIMILGECNAQLLTATIASPDRPDTLLNLCIAGAAKLGCDLGNPVYRDRLHRELALIADKQFEDYFYIVWDICRFARSQMIVGPARGSSCGSLACYLLGITTIDPIPYGLIFERFIDVNRDDLPDIDIDFSDQQRHLVFAYINEKYGAERVARLGTVAMYQPRSALSESGAALRVPRWKCDAVAESLIERSSGDSRALQSLEDTLTGTPPGRSLIEDYPEMIVSARMEGHPRHYSQHAAGIVIAAEPITNYVAIDHRSGATMCDKKDAEDYSLLKIDALGLTQLSVFEDCLAMAGLHRDILDQLPMDDQAAFDVLNAGKFSGIFQFNGPALKALTRQFKIDKFDDLVSITALARPGPLASGGAEEWVRRRIGERAVTYPHPIFQPFMHDTLGIVLYQEQVMNIGREIGDLDWGQVTALRKAMSKSLGKEYFDQFGDPWKKGAIAKGVDPMQAAKVWDELCAYGAWSFNKSHSVAYGLISYQCCWLKAHYPFEFAAATLSHESDPARQIQLLREMAAEGYGYVPIDPELSIDKWVVGSRDGQRVLVGPLSNVHGIGPKLVEAIIGARCRGDRKMPSAAAKKLLNPKTPIDSLFPIRDAFRRVMPDPAARNIYSPPTSIVDIQLSGEDREVLVFCTLSRIDLKNENEPAAVARRGHEIKDGKTDALNLRLLDDTDEIFAKIDRWKFDAMGRPIVDRGQPGKCLYAVKGRVRGGSNFRMIMVKQVRYIGKIDDPAPQPMEDAKAVVAQAEAEEAA